MSSDFSTPPTQTWSTCTDSEPSTPPSTPDSTRDVVCDALTTYGSGSSIGGPRVGCCQLPGSTLLPPNLESYMAFRRDAFHDAYECGSQCRKCVPGVARYLANNPTENLMAKAATHAGSILELAARCATGCAAPLRPDAALLFTDIVLKRNRAHEQMGSRLSLSDKDHVHAHAAASLAFLTKYRLKPTAGSLLAYLEDADLLHAVTEADTAIDNGFRFAGAFEVAAVVLQLGEAHAQDVRGGARFGKYKQVWRAYDVRQRILEKMRHAPSRYTCAEPSCGFRSLKAHQFRRCAGSCSPEVKPGYCSKACQRKDWARHKAACEPRRLKLLDTQPSTPEVPQHNHTNCEHTHTEVRNY